MKQKAFLLISGTVLFLFLLEASMRIGGFLVLFTRDTIESISSPRFKGCRILCIGESTTYDGGAYSYPGWLQKVLDKRSSDLKFKVINLGIPGITTGTIVGQLKNNLEKYQPDIVIMMMGVNDGPGLKIKDIVSDPKNSKFPRNLKLYKLFKLLFLNMQQNKKSPVLPADSVLAKKIAMLKGLIDKEPANPFVRLALAYYYKSQKNQFEIEKMYKGAIKKVMPSDDLARAYADLARFYWEEGKFDRIEDIYKTSIKENPKVIRFYCDLGNYYRDRYKFKQAESIFKKALEIEPGNNVIYDNLGDCYSKQGRSEEAELMYKKAKQLSPDHINTAFELRGKEFREIGRYEDIEKLYSSILELDPKDSFVYYQLGKNFEKQGKNYEAERMYKLSIEFNPADYRGYGTLALLYQKLGQTRQAKDYFKKARDIKIKNFYSPFVVSNYLKAKEIILEKKIRLVWVQYPMWEVQPLKDILDEDDGIIFVDNEKSFKDGVNKSGYSAYFIDRFAGDFGHCTKEGNRLLAENIVNSIFKEIKPEEYKQWSLKN